MTTQWLVVTGGARGIGASIARAAIEAAGADAGYITGQTIAVDGGISVAALSSLSRPRSVDRVGV